MEQLVVVGSLLLAAVEDRGLADSPAEAAEQQEQTLRQLQLLLSWVAAKTLVTLKVFVRLAVVGAVEPLKIV